MMLIQWNSVAGGAWSDRRGLATGDEVTVSVCNGYSFHCNALGAIDARWVQMRHLCCYQGKSIMLEMILLACRLWFLERDGTLAYRVGLSS
jgi:hypothetical protein